MTSKSFALLATVTASTKRNPVVSGGKRGVPVTNLEGLACTPLDAVSAEIRERLELDTPHELLQTMVQGGPDIKEGDVLVVDSTEYPIREVEDWNWRPDETDTLRLILEDLKR